MSRILWAWAVAVAGGLLAPVPVLADPAKPVQTLVLDRAVARGQLLAADDFTVARRDPAQAQGALTLRDAAGREATRDLPAGSLLHTGDVIAARLVRRGEPVTINVRAPGLAISTQGKALSAGALGDLVRVFSTTTNRTFDATVDGPASVRLVTP
jgi:flagella basal body P-ring formation protein FlgA